MFNTRVLCDNGVCNSNPVSLPSVSVAKRQLDGLYFYCTTKQDLVHRPCLVVRSRADLTDCWTLFSLSFLPWLCWSDCSGLTTRSVTLGWRNRALSFGHAALARWQRGPCLPSKDFHIATVAPLNGCSWLVYITGSINISISWLPILLHLKSNGWSEDFAWMLESEVKSMKHCNTNLTHYSLVKLRGMCICTGSEFENPSVSTSVYPKITWLQLSKCFVHTLRGIFNFHLTK